jgi:hypothetical protein
MSPPASLARPPPADDRLICMVLAAQVAALRDRMHAHSPVDSLWQGSDAVSRLAAASRAAPPELLAGLRALGSGLEELAFGQAQLADCLGQMADCVVRALLILARSDAPAGARLPLNDLLTLYVTEEQRRVHVEVAGRFAVAEPGPANHDAG